MTPYDPTEITACDIISAFAAVAPTVENLSPCYRLSEGSEHAVWCIGNNFILRGLPVNGRPEGKSEESLRRDTAISLLLRRYVSHPNSAPEVLTTIEISVWICNIEVRIHGKSLESVQPTKCTEEDLAALLEGLASIPAEEAREVVGCEEWAEDMSKCVSKAMRSWDELVQSGYIPISRENMHTLLTQRLALLSTMECPGQPDILLHADIKGEHILVDHSGRVNGILDWSDSTVGDPCRDVAGISLSVGQMMARRIGTKASYPTHTVEKGLLYAMCLTILNLHDRICGNDDSPEQLLKSQLGRAFEATDVVPLSFSRDQATAC